MVTFCGVKLSWVKAYNSLFFPEWQQQETQAIISVKSMLTYSLLVLRTGMVITQGQHHLQKFHSILKDLKNKVDSVHPCM